MAKLTNDTNQVESPVDIAMQMLAGTQDIIFNSILGPQQAQRVDKIAGEPVDSIIDLVIQDSTLLGQSIQENQVTTPERPMPSPMPSPAPPSEPPTQPSSPLGEISDIMGMLGGGMNNGI